MKHPSAGDIFTAYELGSALENLYPKVKVRYLYQFKTWYKPELLHDVDFLISMLDQYELDRLLSMFRHTTTTTTTSTSTSTMPNFVHQNPTNTQCKKSYQLKPNLVTIAWARNWFHRWLARPWFGNYDLVLTSSQLSKDFYDQISEKIGLSTSCINACPHRVERGTNISLTNNKYLPTSDNNNFNFSLLFNTTTHKTTTHPWSYSAIRSKVPVFTFRLATSLEYYRNPTSNTSDILSNRPSQDIQKKAAAMFSGIDYIFTGSYFRVYRKVMSFDPKTIPQWKGLIVGKNWNNANNVSKEWKKICVDFQPYDVVKEVCSRN